MVFFVPTLLLQLYIHTILMTDSVMHMSGAWISTCKSVDKIDRPACLLPCIIVNENRRAKENGVGLGTRLGPDSVWVCLHKRTLIASSYRGSLVRT